ncbi:acyltransferase [Enterococcus sp. DIV0170]|uniref:acyltransferase n=1 Tax=Enterococcus sp. DIV0170 TaxID=2774642 RepID=UPI003F210AC7
MKKILLTLIQYLLGLLEKINLDLYKKFYPKFLRYRGIKIPKNFRTKFGDAYIHPSVHFDGKDYSLISIGANTTISKEVEFLTHDYSISKALIANGNFKKGGFFLKPVSVGENCFIGARTIILPGTRIGDNVIVGAGSVVKGKIDSNIVIGGNPAKKIIEIDAFLENHLEKNDIYYYDYSTGDGEVIAK